MNFFKKLLDFLLQNYFSSPYGNNYIQNISKKNEAFTETYDLFIDVASIGDLGLFTKLNDLINIEKYPVLYTHICSSALKNGQFEIFKILAKINKVFLLNEIISEDIKADGKFDRDTLLTSAARRGRLDSVQFLFKTIADSQMSFSRMKLSKACEAAAENNHSDVVKFFIQSFGVNNLNMIEILKGAVRSGNSSMVEYLFHLAYVNDVINDSEFNNIFTLAIRGGHFDIIEFLFNKSEPEDQQTLLSSNIVTAVTYGHKDIVQLIIEFLTPEYLRDLNFNLITISAIINNKVDTLAYIFEKFSIKAEQSDDASLCKLYLECCRLGHFQMLKYLSEEFIVSRDELKRILGDKLFECFNISVQGHHPNISNYIFELFDEDAQKRYDVIITCLGSYVNERSKRPEIYEFGLNKPKIYEYLLNKLPDEKFLSNKLPVYKFLLNKLHNYNFFGFNKLDFYSGIKCIKDFMNFLTNDPKLIEETLKSATAISSFMLICPDPLLQCYKNSKSVFNITHTILSKIIESDCLPFSYIERMCNALVYSPKPINHYKIDYLEGLDSNLREKISYRCNFMKRFVENEAPNRENFNLGL